MDSEVTFSEQGQGSCRRQESGSAAQDDPYGELTGILEGEGSLEQIMLSIPIGQGESEEEELRGAVAPPPRSPSREKRNQGNLDPRLRLAPVAKRGGGVKPNRGFGRI